MVSGFFEASQSVSKCITESGHHQLSTKVQLFRRGFFLKISSLKASEQATGIDRFAIEVRSRLVRESLSLVQFQ